MLSQALPGSTSIAAIGWVSVSTTTAVKPPPAALVAVAHLPVMYRHDPVLAHSVPDPLLAVSIIGITATSTVRTALHVLEQQLSQQLRRVNYRLMLRTIGGQPSLGLPGQFQQPVGIGHNCAQQVPPRPLVGPVNFRLTLHATAHVPLVAMSLSPLPQRHILHRRQSPHQLHDAVGQQIVGVLHRSPAQSLPRT